MDAITEERQIKLEADAVEEGLSRYRVARKHQLPTHSKEAAAFLIDSLKPLSDAILAEQLALKDSQARRKLPKYGVPLLSLNHEKLALITLGTIFNLVSRMELEEGALPSRTTVAYEIGQRCRIERIFDRARTREVNLSKELRNRNLNRNAIVHDS